MMYCEFIERTHYGEKYITESVYHEYIEPAYMEAPDKINKDQFCKDFYKQHAAAVSNVVSGLIIAKSIEEKENYISTGNGFTDIQAAHETLLKIFLRAYKGISKELYR